MWVRKSEEEIQKCITVQQRQQKNLWRPLAIAAILTTIGSILYAVGIRSLFRGWVVISSRPARLGLRELVMVAGLFAIFFAIAVYHQRREGKVFISGTSLLCRECKEPSHVNQAMRCDCGGLLEPYDYFDWSSEATDAATVESGEVHTTRV
jgi:hypothetical protein